MQTIPTLFKCNKWTDTPIPGTVDGLVHGHLDGEYVGDEIKGDVVCSYIMSPYGPTAKEAGKSLMTCRFEGQQLFSGTVLGKKGTFAARESGHCVGGNMSVEFAILPETATGELVGIKGKASYTVSMEGPCGEDKAVPGTVEIEMP